VSVKGRISARRIVTVYRHIPSLELLMQTLPTKAPLFYENSDELDILRKSHIDIKLLARSQYDPMEVGT
jgi:hypothetical protein